MTRRAPPPASSSWLAVTDGQHRIGHVLSRGRSGWEAFDANDVSIGIYPTQSAAIVALTHVVVEARR
jgi:hypothetical protein